MKKVSFVVLMAALPGFAGAAGTYYNGGSYQQRYGTNGGGYYNSYGVGRSAAMPVQANSVQKTNTRKANMPSNSKQGFYVGADLSHQMASWDFNMKTAGSALHYDDLRWNVLNGHAVYYFGDSTPMQINVGASYGVQFGESEMVDDDITKGGYVVTSYASGETLLGYQTGHALSLGTSKDGKQMGFNASFGFTDAFTIGSVKITPSVGYRYFKYEVFTKQNYGVALDVFESTDAHPYVNCFSVNPGEVQCDPFLLWKTGSGNVLTGRTIDSAGNLSTVIPIPGGATAVHTGGTYYYEQSGTSHKYDTTWMGPYVALDMEYAINNDNTVTAGIELGLPTYTSEGDQPYRVDWAHPTSVKDEGAFGDAYHLGLNAMWTTAIGKSTSLSFGFTYDYYKVSGASATTFLSAAYHEDLYDTYQYWLDNSATLGLTADDIAAIQYDMSEIDQYRASGWELKDEKEIDSIYKSMGIRIGLNVKF